MDQKKIDIQISYIEILGEKLQKFLIWKNFLKQYLRF